MDDKKRFAKTLAEREFANGIRYMRNKNVKRACLCFESAERHMMGAGLKDKVYVDILNAYRDAVVELQELPDRKIEGLDERLEYIDKQLRFIRTGQTA
jgi:hypothetical protein